MSNELFDAEGYPIGGWEEVLGKYQEKIAGLEADLAATRAVLEELKAQIPSLHESKYWIGLVWKIDDTLSRLGTGEALK